MTEQQASSIRMLIAYIGFTICDLLAAPSVKTNVTMVAWFVILACNAVLYVMAEVREVRRWRGR